ncbi:hypothetical protein HPB51_016234 [Rhipicephalus microplus]|uniref:Serine/threonine-protein kinase haspin C-terminal domain-containing protein n=1 Tax=Rhipicephalus microplus TaxID=6941 RepID=A0A9J6EH15_RHIMP|nr:hypothetical protein HPB51_016234 [Rhipicephalus microplus]
MILKRTFSGPIVVLGKHSERLFRGKPAYVILTVVACFPLLCTNLSRLSLVLRGSAKLITFTDGDVNIDEVRDGDDWEAYHPRTNALWLSYLLQKLTNKLPRTKQVAKGFTSGGRLASWTDAVLALPSAEAFVVEHVALQPKRKAEALTKKRRWERPQNKEPDARSARTRYALR